jgi:hypothetical protein
LKCPQIGLGAAAGHSARKESRFQAKRTSSYFYHFVDQFLLFKGPARNTDFSGNGLPRMENREESFKIQKNNASIKPIIG